MKLESIFIKKREREKRIVKPKGGYYGLKLKLYNKKVKKKTNEGKTSVIVRPGKWLEKPITVRPMGGHMSLVLFTCTCVS